MFTTLQSQHKSTSIEELLQICAQDLKKVDQEISDRLNSSIQLIPTLADHLISAGGKKIRPMLTIAIAYMIKGDLKAPIKFAAAIELIHSATLLHDDIVDGSLLRRGRKTANRVWGNAASVLVGDYLFSQAFSLMVAGENLKALKLLSATAGIITEGEVHQLVSLNNLNLEITDYYKVIQAKTAALFSAACEVNAVLEGLSEEQRIALQIYGTELGLAFQISDDALDYGGITDQMGKTAGDDFKEQKVTLPVLLSYQRSNPRDKAFWERSFTKGQQQDPDFSEAKKVMKKTSALKKTLEIAHQHAEKARNSLSCFAYHPIKPLLECLPAQIVERVY